VQHIVKLQNAKDNGLAWAVLAVGLLSVPVAFLFALFLGSQTTLRGGPTLGYSIAKVIFFLGLGCTAVAGLLRHRPWYDRVFWGILGMVFFAAVVCLCIAAVILFGGISIQT